MVEAHAPVTSNMRTFTPVCAIGASAGGVGALQAFFGCIGDDLGLAYVVIIRLSPNHPSALSEILSGCTTMPVRQVEEKARLQPNHVYVIPPDRELVIEGDDVAARPFREPRGQRAPIDMFFRSVAAGRGDGLSVVLSGAGSDGSVGVRAVKEAGDVVFVQDPQEAQYPMMPRIAIPTGGGRLRRADPEADRAHRRGDEEQERGARADRGSRTGRPAADRRLPQGADRARLLELQARDGDAAGG